MATPQDDLLVSLQSSLRNTLYTFGPDSAQYHSIKQMVDEHIAKSALATTAQQEKGKSDVGAAADAGLGTGFGCGRVMNLVFRPKGA